MKFIILSALFAIQFNVSAQTENFCIDELNQKINEILKNDEHNIITTLYHITQLKMAHQIDATNDSLFLETYIKNQLMGLDQLQLEKTKKEIEKLYQEYGKLLSSQKSYELIEKFKDKKYYDSTKRLSPDEMPAVIRIIGSLNQERSQSPHLHLDENDEAVSWLIAEINKQTNLNGVQKNLVASTAIAHYTGAIRGDIKLSQPEKEHEIAKLKMKLETSLEKIKDDFFQMHSACIAEFGQGKCFKQKLKATLFEKIKDLVSLGHDKSHLTTLDQKEDIILRLRQKLEITLNPAYIKKGKEKNRLDQSTSKPELLSFKELNSQEEIESCGGKSFRSQIKDVEVIGFSSPVGSFKSAKKAFDNYKSGGVNAVKGMNKKVNFFSKFQIPGPFFRCEPEPVKKVPRFAYKKAKKLVCCEEKPQWKHLQYIFASFGGGFSCRIFIGLPYIAELGAKVGASVNIGFGGGIEPTECIDKSCAQGKVSFAVSSALYADALVGLASVQGTISWIPYATIKQCVHSNGFIPPANLGYKIGSVIFIGTVRAGWAMTYEVVKPIYEDEKVTSMDIAIF